MRTPPAFRSLFTLAAGALCVSAAWSQSAADAPAAAASQAAGDSGVMEIVVTAQRREQTLSNVPASVTAMNAAMLEKQGTKDLADIGRLTPGLAVGTPDSGGASTIAIRGIASNVGAPTTGVYIDDVPVQVSNLASCTLLCAASAIPKIFDLERVEVLRGPQGTLYGSSSEGGAVRFITATPRVAGDFGGSVRSDVSVTQGGSPSVELGATIDGPLQTDVSGFRLSVWSRHDGGWVDRYSPQTGDLVGRNVNATDAKVARLALRFAPDDRLTITPAFFWQESRQKDRGTFSEALGTDRSGAHVAQPDHDRFGLGSLSVEYDFDSFSLKSITSHLGRTEDRVDDYSNFTVGREALNADGNDYTASSLTRNTQDNWNQELRLTSTDKAGSTLSWVGGLYFQKIRQGMMQAIDEDVGALSTWYADYYGVPELVSSGSQSYLEHYAQTETEAAAFGELNWRLSPRLTASTGLRVTRTRFNYTDDQAGWWAATNGPFSGGDKETPVTPKFGLSFQRTPDNLIYATAARGFRVGGSNESMAGNATCASALADLGMSDVPSTYKSDSVWSYELGDKQKFAGGALSVAGSLYWVNWNNIQGGVMLSCGFGFVTNMATATSKGFDLEVQARPTANLTLSGTLGYDDARYTRTASFEGASGTVVTAKSGDPLNGVPRWSASVAAEYDWQLAPGTPAFARVDYQMVGNYYRTGSEGTVSYDADIREAPRVRLLNLRTGLHRKAWSGSVYVKNATNARTVVSRTHSFTGDTQFTDAALAPRAIGVTLGYDY